MSPLEVEIRRVIEESRPLASREAAVELAALSTMLDQPFRVAVAGMIKAGKSTLLNALVGEKLAPTDAGECTKIVTWYSEGQGYSVEAVSDSGTRQRLSFERGDELVVDLADRSPDGIGHLDVKWPSTRLANKQFVDTPGLGSLSTDVSARTETFLADGTDVPVDAVVYLLRHRHSADLDFLEAFHGGVDRAGATNAIAVLSRADELAGSRADALEVATRVATELEGDRRLSQLVQCVLPVAGLLAETASTLRQEEFGLLEQLARLPEEDVTELLISTDRIMHRTIDGFAATAEQRVGLVRRFGLHGLRLAVQLLRTGEVHTAGTLAQRLRSESGIETLLSEIEQRFGMRSQVLRARTALHRLTRLVHDPSSGLTGLAGEVERVKAMAHELVEVDLLEQLRSGAAAELNDDDRARLMRLLGGSGADITRRLQLEPDRNPLSRLNEELEHWQRWAENPLAGPQATAAARAGVRTCEALVAVAAG